MFLPPTCHSFFGTVLAIVTLFLEAGVTAFLAACMIGPVFEAITDEGQV